MTNVSGFSKQITSIHAKFNQFYDHAQSDDWSILVKEATPLINEFQSFLDSMDISRLPLPIFEGDDRWWIDCWVHDVKRVLGYAHEAISLPEALENIRLGLRLRTMGALRALAFDLIEMFDIAQNA